MLETAKNFLQEHVRTISHRFNIQTHIDPVVSYINRDRSKDQDLYTNTVIDIPISRNERVSYSKKSADWRTDRNMQFYNATIFSDEFEYLVTPEHGIQSHRIQDSTPVLGGRHTAFAPGKRVLELGSGEAVALLQYARMYPQTAFIGVDYGYQPSMMLNLKRTKPQLIHDNWDQLATFPDACIDTFISVQGGMTWGTQRTSDRSIPMLDAITRVAKPGAIIRSDDLNRWKNDQFEVDYLKKLGWTVRDEKRYILCVKS